MTPIQPRVRDLRVFATGLMIFAVAGAIVAGRAGSPTLVFAAAGLAAVLGGVALFAPRRIEPVYRPWMRVAAFIGICMSKILLTVIYFTLLLPFLFIKRRDPLALRHNDGDSYWERVTHEEWRIDRFERPF